MNGTRVIEAPIPGAMCANCGIPLDAQYFDESGIAKDVDKLEPGREVLLARFELHPQYCGVLEYFSQFTDAYAKDPSRIETPGLEWLILSSRRPLYPYIRLDRVLNPWGYGSFQFAVRLEIGATVEFVVRRLAGPVGVPFFTAIRKNIAASPSPQAVTPASMTNMSPDGKLLVDTGAAREEVTVISVTTRTFTAIFQNNHTAPVAVEGNTLTQVGGRIVGRYWYNPAYGDVERRSL